jgi:hypothetical protein
MQPSAELASECSYSRAKQERRYAAERSEIAYSGIGWCFRSLARSRLSMFG